MKKIILFLGSLTASLSMQAIKQTVTQADQKSLTKIARTLKFIMADPVIAERFSHQPIAHEAAHIIQEVGMQQKMMTKNTSPTPAQPTEAKADHRAPEEVNVIVQ